MKVRIKSHSVRFRLKGDDLDRFLASGSLVEETHIPTHDGESVVFSLGIQRGTETELSHLQAEPYGLILRLSPADCLELASPDKEGVYIRSEWINDAGKAIRFVAYVEKDKKKSSKHGDKVPEDQHG